jgi:hypothetical protein
MVICLIVRRYCAALTSRSSFVKKHKDRASNGDKLKDRASNGDKLKDRASNGDMPKDRKLPPVQGPPFMEDPPRISEP